MIPNIQPLFQFNGQQYLSGTQVHSDFMSDPAGVLLIYDADGGLWEAQATWSFLTLQREIVGDPSHRLRRSFITGSFLICYDEADANLQRASIVKNFKPYGQVGEMDASAWVL
jgi:hypothetical protein